MLKNVKMCGRLSQSDGCPRRIYKSHKILYMKKLFTLILLVATVLCQSSCISVKETNVIKASRNVITKNATISDITKIIVNDQIDVEVVQGPYSARIIGPDNIVPIAELKQHNGTLTVGFKNGNYSIKYPHGIDPLKVVVSLPAVSELTVKDQSTLTAGILECTTAVIVKASDQSSINIKGITSAGTLTLESEDQSSLTVSDVASPAVVIKAEDQASATINNIVAASSLQTDSEDQSSLTVVTAEANSAVIEAADQSFVKINLLKVATARAKATDQSDIKIRKYTGTISQSTSDQASIKVSK